MIGSIEEKLFVLPDETAVLCGHGPETSIGLKKKIIHFYSKELVWGWSSF
ncbi:hypothetical protein ACT7DL_07175 [Bacillus paranthracis]